MTEPVKCEHCEHMFKPYGNAKWFSWLCLKHKRVTPTQFVADSNELDDPPYGRCKTMNLGACPLWTPKRSNPEGES